MEMRGRGIMCVGGGWRVQVGEDCRELTNKCEAGEWKGNG